MNNHVVVYFYTIFFSFIILYYFFLFIITHTFALKYTHCTGVFRKGIDGVDVSAVAVHPAGGVLAASYRSGEVRIYNYPCQSQQVTQKSYTFEMTRSSR